MNPNVLATEQRQLSTATAAQLVNGASAKGPQQSQDTPKGIAQKLLAVMRELNYIQRDKRNAEHGYTYASEAAIKRNVQAALVNHGVLFELSALGYTERPAGKDGRDTLILMQFQFAFEDVETGERREGLFYGSGIDGRDKGLYKAITGAIKYILTSRFLIPTGDDPENDVSADLQDDPDPAGRNVDTGGARWGTREAAQNVARDKLAKIAAEAPESEFQAQRKVAEVGYRDKIKDMLTGTPAQEQGVPGPDGCPPPPPLRKPVKIEKPWKSDTGMKECFRVARERVGEVIWNAVLRQFDVDNPSQFKEPADAMAAYNLMLGLSKMEGLKNGTAA